MVTGLILQWAASAVSFIVGLFPNPALPDWLGAVPSWLPAAITAGNEMGAWFPLDAIRNGVGLLLVLWGVALAIRLARIALSFIPFIGGTSG